MSKIKELLKIYSTIVSDIFSEFGVDRGYGKFVDNTENRWINFDGYISYFDSENIRYGYDSSSECGTNGDYILFYISDNGEDYYTIFDKTKLLTEEQFNELEN